MKDYKQRPLFEWDQYSVIDKLLHAETETKQLAGSKYLIADTCLKPLRGAPINAFQREHGNESGLG